MQAELTRRGLLPEVDQDGFPVYPDGKWPSAERIVDDLNNLQAVNAISAEWLEAHYNQASQDGVTVDLIQHRTGRPPRYVTIMVRLRQGEWTFEGTTPGEGVVRRSLSSSITTRTVEVNEGVGVAVVGGNASLEDPAPPGPGANVDWSGDTTGSVSVTDRLQNNQMTLIEGTGDTAVFTVKHELTAWLLDDDDEQTTPVPDSPESKHPPKPELAATSQGSATVLLPADLLPETAQRQLPDPPPPDRPPSPRAQRLGKTVAIDGRGLLGAARKVLTRSGTSRGGMQKLRAMFDAGALTVNDGPLLGLPYDTNTLVDLGLLRTPGPAGVSVEFDTKPAEFVGSWPEAYIGDVKLALVSDGVSHSRDRSRGLEGRVTYLAGGDLSGDRVAGVSQTTTRGRGRERIAVNIVNHYVYRIPFAARVTGDPGEGSERVDGLTVVRVWSEPKALALWVDGELPVPMDQVADAIARYASGYLHLDRHVAVGVLRRYRAQLRQHGGPQPDDLASERFDTKDGLARRLAARLMEAFPDADIPKNVTEPADQIDYLLEHGLALPPVPPEDAGLRLPDRYRQQIGATGIEDVVLFPLHRGREHVAEVGTRSMATGPVAAGSSAPAGSGDPAAGATAGSGSPAPAPPSASGSQPVPGSSPAPVSPPAQVVRRPPAQVPSPSSGGSPEHIELFDQVLRQIKTVAPDALSRTPGLGERIAAELSGRRWESLFDLVVDGNEWKISTRVALGGYQTGLLTISIKIVDLDEGRTVGREPTVELIDHHYSREESSRGESAARSAGVEGHSGALFAEDVFGNGSPAGNSDESRPPGADVGTNIGRDIDGSVTRQDTLLQRSSGGDDGVILVRRTGVLVSTVSVSEIERTPEAIMRTEPEVVDDAIDPVGLVSTRPVESTLRFGVAFLQMVPVSQMVPPTRSEPTGPFRPRDVRPVSLPSRFGVDVVQYGKLIEAISSRLARPDLLGPRGMRRYQSQLEAALNPLTGNADLLQMFGDSGSDILTVPVPERRFVRGRRRYAHARGPRMAVVNVRARASNLRAEPIGVGEIGRIERGQQTSTLSDTHTWPSPVSRSGAMKLPGAEDGGVGVRVQLSGGAQSSSTSSTTRGDRDETNLHWKGELSHVVVDVAYEVTITVVRRGTTGDRVVRRIRLPHIGTVGQAHLRLLASDVDDIRRRLTTGEHGRTWTFDERFGELDPALQGRADRNPAADSGLPAAVRPALPPPDAGPSAPPDTSHTAREMPGAPAHPSGPAPDEAAAALRQAMLSVPGLEGTFDDNVLVPPTSELPRLRFEVGRTPPGIRAYREEITSADRQPAGGSPEVRVVVSDEITNPDQLRRIILHEQSEAYALHERGPVNRIRAWFRRTPTRDSLTPDGDPPGTELSPHDHGHRAEVVLLARQVAAGRTDLERELGLLLDAIGVGVPDPTAPAARHADRRLAMLNLPDELRQVVEPLRPHDAAWRRLSPREAPRVRAAIDEALPRLAVRARWSDDSVVEITAGGRTRAVDLTPEMLALANSGLSGPRLVDRAAALVGARLTGVVHHAAVVVPGTEVADRMATPAKPAKRKHLREKLDALRRHLETRWELGGTDGQVPRGDSFVRGIEPLPERTRGVLHIRVHPRRGQPFDAQVRISRTGITDESGARLRAASRIVIDQKSGRPEFRIAIAPDHPSTDDLVATLAHEAAELVTAVRRRRWHAGPGHGQDDLLTPGDLPARWLRRDRLSPSDIGGIADLETKVQQLAVAVEPDEWTRLVRDIEAIRQHLGLDPTRDGRSAQRRWRLVDRQLRTRNLGPTARRYWAALHEPNWPGRALRHGIAAYLAEYAGQQVRVTEDGTFEVSSWSRSRAVADAAGVRLHAARDAGRDDPAAGRFGPGAGAAGAG